MTISHEKFFLYTRKCIERAMFGIHIPIQQEIPLQLHIHKSKAKRVPENDNNSIQIFIPRI